MDKKFNTIRRTLETVLGVWVFANVGMNSASGPLDHGPAVMLAGLYFAGSALHDLFMDR